MAPKESAKVRSARLANESASLAIKADGVIIAECLRTNPSCIRHVMKLLVDLKYVTPLGDVSEVDVEQQVSKQKKKSDAPATPSAKEKAALADRSPPSETVPEKWMVLSDADVDFLVHALSFMEPASCSQHALRGLFSGAQRKHKRAPLLEMVQLATDIEPDADLTVFGTYGHFLDHLCLLNSDNGRRLHDVQVPVQYQQNGIYRLTLNDDGDLVVTERMTGQAAIVTNDRLTKPAFKITDFVIQKNWPKVSAAVTRIGTYHPVRCSELLGQHLRPAKEINCIADGAVESPAPARQASGAQRAPLALPPPETPPVKRARVASSPLGEQPQGPHAASSSAAAPSSGPPEVSPKVANGKKAPPAESDEVAEEADGGDEEAAFVPNTD